MERSRVRPFLPYPGSKRRHLQYIIPNLPKDGFENYFEPFVGMGAVFFALGDRIKKRATLIDKNQYVVDLYRTMRDEPNRLAARLSELDDKYDMKNGVFDECMTCNDTTPIDRAVRTIVIATRSFGSLQLQVSGLVYGNERVYDYRRIVPMMEYVKPYQHYPPLMTAEISCGDFTLAQPKKNDFVYLDPPYDRCNKHLYKACGKLFTSLDQMRLAEKVKQWDADGVKIMISNKDTSLVRWLYQGFRQVRFDMLETITTGRRNLKKGTPPRVEELLLMNYE